jgi:multisubunit Na+/H+ antiporter MnhG subunit
MIQLIQEQAICLQKALENHMTKIILGLMAFLAPIQGILITVGVLILADTIIGLWKARKLKEKISSRKLSQIISKMFLYEGTIILFFMIDKFILGDILQQFFAVEFLLTKVVALVLASIEVFSMDENYRAVRKYGLWHAFKKLVGRARDVKEELKDFDIDNLK